MNRDGLDGEESPPFVHLELSIINKNSTNHHLHIDPKAIGTQTVGRICFLASDNISL